MLTQNSFLFRMNSPVKLSPIRAKKLDVERDQRVTWVRKGLPRLYF